MYKLVLAFALAASPALASDIYTFEIPNGGVNITGPVGITTGWDYSIHNESSSLWLVTTGLSSGVFQYATPTLLFDFPDIAPGATVSVPFDPITSSGLFEITWDQNVPDGHIASGTFDLTAEWWNGDPLNGGTLVSSAPGASVAYSASPTTITPEPATFGLFGVSLLFGVALIVSAKQSRDSARTASFD